MTAIEFLDLGPDAGNSADNSAFLFLHGLGGSAEAWRPQLDELCSGARCVAWTMPGYGASVALPVLTIDTLATAAVSLLDDLGIARAVVVGHSLGGYVAQELALSYPERVERLVLVATTAAFGKPGSTFNQQFLAARLEPLDRGLTPADLAPDVVEGLVAPGTGASARREAAAMMSTIGADAYRRALNALVAWDARDRLAEIRAPTLCIAGEHDTTSPPRAMQRLADAIPGARFELVACAGHLLNLEQPARFNLLLKHPWT